MPTGMVGNWREPNLVDDVSPNKDHQPETSLEEPSVEFLLRTSRLLAFGFGVSTISLL